MSVFLRIMFVRQDNLGKDTFMNKKLKKSVSAALICAMMLTTAATALNVTAYADTTTKTTTSTAAKSYTVKGKMTTMYIFDPSIKGPNALYFVNGTDIPYIDLAELLPAMKSIMSIFGVQDFNMDIKTEGNKMTITRETGFPCIIDFAEDTIYYYDFNGFNKFGEDQSLIDVSGLQTKDENGKLTYLKRLKDDTTERYGDDVTLDLGAYNIDLVRKGDKYLMPLQTFNDVFLFSLNMSVFYNGKALFLASGDAMLDSDNNRTALGKLYYKDSVKKDKLSKELTEFNYNELCFALDTHYGLKEIHNIKSFDNLFRNNGLKEYMLSGNPQAIDTAVYYLATRYLDDVHTKYGMASPASGYKLKKEFLKIGGEGPSRDASFALGKKFEAARAKYYPDGVPAYEEIGDTAFITFDEFVTVPADVDHYKTAPTAKTTDTMGIISYSVQQILRKDSPVKNVVLDLSCNVGGSVDTAIYTVGAFLGKTAVSIEDSFTGALVTSAYSVDTNLDHKFNSKDYLAGKGLNLYCLESGVSFSCGNLVPSLFKQSDEVSLIGQASGGGACSVLWISTATGSSIRISSPNRLSFMKNGAFYDVDRGADPDIYLTKKDSYYDREKLVEYLNSLL